MKPYEPGCFDIIARPFTILYDTFWSPISQDVNRREVLESRIKDLTPGYEELAYHTVNRPLPTEEDRRPAQEELAAINQRISDYWNGNHSPNLAQRIERHHVMRSVGTTVANAVSAGLLYLGASALMDAAPQTVPSEIRTLFFSPAAYMGLLTIAEPLFCAMTKRKH